MPHTYTATFPLRAMRSALTVLTLGALLACGGGGGGERPAFEAVSVSGVQGVQDNSTGLVWARQLGDAGLPSQSPLPTASDALYYADRNTLLDDPLFSFLGTLRAQDQAPYVVVSESNEIGTAWVVDLFERPGSLSKLNAGERLSTPPGFHVWYKLNSQSVPRSTLVDLRNGTVSNEGLVWQLCSVGGSFSAGRCGGSAEAMTYAEAQAHVAEQAAAGWRLPTKAELQDLLQLTNNDSSRSLMREPFNQADVIADSAFLPYWTASAFGSADTVWVVNFSAQGNNGGINTEDVNLSASSLEPTAFVRLVRGSR